MNTLLVTAYTPGYLDLARRLVESGRKQGVPVVARPYESSGDWVPSSDVFARWIKGFEWASSQVRAKVVVLEVSKGDSALECFEKRLAEEVL